MFASISGRNRAGLQDTLEAYLEAPPLSTVEDPLEYWNLVQKTSTSPLAQMAIDFLTAQGMFSFSSCCYCTDYLLMFSYVYGLRTFVLTRPADCVSAASFPE